VRAGGSERDVVAVGLLGAELDQDPSVRGVAVAVVNDGVVVAVDDLDAFYRSQAASNALL